MDIALICDPAIPTASVDGPHLDDPALPDSELARGLGHLGHPGPPGHGFHPP